MEKIESILYVEDEKNIRESLSQILKRFCNNLFLAENGEEGLTLYKSHNPKIVVTDIKMPVMNGIELAENIKEINQDAKIIFLTAFSDFSMLQEAISLQAEGYLVKPIDMDLLEKTLIKVKKTYQLEEKLKEKTANELIQKQKLETILSTTKDGISILDLNTRFLYANDAFLQMLGYTFEELEKLSSLELTSKDDMENAHEVLKEVIEKGYKDNYIKKYIRKDSNEVYVNISTSLMPDTKSILISTKDITKEIYTQKKLKEYIEIINDNVITLSTDLNGTVTEVSNAFSDISGYSKEEIIGKRHSLIKHEDTPDKIHKDIWETITKNKVWKGELKNKKPNGEPYFLYSKIYSIYDEHKNRSGYTSISQDITYLKQVKELSVKDGLTNIYNKRFFDEIFTKYINSAKRDKELVSFMMIDVDFFKKYNDTYGHQKGDEVLISISKVLNDAFKRADDYTFRLGGEEFGGLFKVKDHNKSLIFAKGICEKIRDLKIPHIHGVNKYVTASIGLISINAEDIENERKLYKQVDDLLYQAKEDGRDKVKSNLTQG